MMNSDQIKTVYAAARHYSQELTENNVMKKLSSMIEDDENAHLIISSTPMDIMRAIVFKKFYQEMLKHGIEHPTTRHILCTYFLSQKLQQHDEAILKQN